MTDQKNRPLGTHSFEVLLRRHEHNLGNIANQRRSQMRGKFLQELRNNDQLTEQLTQLTTEIDNLENHSKLLKEQIDRLLTYGADLLLISTTSYSTLKHLKDSWSNHKGDVEHMDGVFSSIPQLESTFRKNASSQQERMQQFAGLANEMDELGF